MRQKKSAAKGIDCTASLTVVKVILRYEKCAKLWDFVRQTF